MDQPAFVAGLSFKPNEQTEGEKNSSIFVCPTLRNALFPVVSDLRTYFLRSCLVIGNKIRIKVMSDFSLEKYFFSPCSCLLGWKMS